MQCAFTHLLPATPPEDYEDPLNLVQSVADLSLDFGPPPNPSGWVPPFSPVHHPPSYDPMSPTYDPCAASPCNPFPTTSPFATFTFAHPKKSSRLRFDDSYPNEVPELSPTTSQHSLSPPPPSLHVSQAAALSRIPPPHSAPSLRRTKPCRFYLDPGGCKSGKWCNFKHPLDARSEDCSYENSTLDELRAAVVRSRIANNVINGDMSQWDDVPDVRDLDPNWGKKGDDDVHPKWRTQPCRNFILGTCRYGDKCQFIHAPGLFPATSPESYPSSLPLPVALDIPLNNSTSHPIPVPLSVWGPHPGIGVPAGACSPEAVTKAKPEQMSLFYRTKPCKFFEANGTCPHGSDCKFIHDPKKYTPVSAISDTASPYQHPSWADDTRELDFEQTPSFSELEDSVSESEADGDAAMQDMTDEGACRSTSKKRRDRARTRAWSAARGPYKKVAQQSGGIFKPTWRVVGGGVMLASPEHNWRDTNIEEDDDVVVLDHQPPDLAAPVVTPIFSHDNAVAQADSFFSITASPTDVHDYDYAVFSVDPSDYLPNELLHPPSPDAQLEVTIGKVDGWNVAPAPRTKGVITGADLMRELWGTGPDEDGSQRQMTSRRTRSPRERHKPRLTIAVPTLDHRHRRMQSQIVRGSPSYSPYPQFQRRRAEASKFSTCTDAGDDILDWGEDGDELECDDGASGDEIRRNGQEARQANGEDIRRARSTPPTPRSSESLLDVPVRARLAAESP